MLIINHLVTVVMLVQLPYRIVIDMTYLRGS